MIIEVLNAHPSKVFQKKPIERLAKAVLRGEQKEARELNIVFVNDREIRRLHREYLSGDYVTDVISFRFDDHKRIEGEVYVNVDQAARQAREYGVRLNEEMYRLVVHGILHLVGYEDHSAEGREVMNASENKYLKWKNR